MTRIAITTLLVSAAALAGCGDNSGGAPDARPPEVSFVRAIVVAGDFNPARPGVLSTYDPATGKVHKNAGPAMVVGDDPVLRHFGHELFIVNRNDGNNVTILDDQTLAFEEQLGTGPNSNPQDVAVVGDKLYVATYGTAGVTVLTRGSISTSVIDLSADDPDGLPECESIYLVDQDLYVVCQLLDDAFAARGPGKVYVIDTTNDQVRATLTLGHKNPFSLLEQVPPGAPHGGELVVGTVRFDDGSNSGCVERIVPGATPQAAGCLVDNADLGGYASRIAFEADAGGAIAYFAVPASNFIDANLRAFDLPTAMLGPPLNAATEVVLDVVVCPGDQVIAADTAKDVNGLRVFAGGTEKTTTALPIGLPPKSTHGLVCY